MKALLASYSDAGGGGARAAMRVLNGIRLHLPDTRMVVAERLTAHPGVLQARPWSRSRLAMGFLRKLNRLPLSRHGPTGGMWSSDWLATGMAGRLLRERPDVVNLHWVQHGGLLPRELARLRCPVVWTLHDLAPLTGGCHYPGACQNWRDACGNCPMLRRRGPLDLSHRGFSEKRSIYASLQPDFVAPSRWLADLACNSPLAAGCHVEHIPNGLDLELFSPAPMAEARRKLGLPAEGQVILFGADRAMRDRRKGFHLLRQALPRLTGISRLSLAVFGASRIDDAHELPFPIHALGVINNDAQLALAYSAADLLVVPSLEDNLPNTIAEALSCGCPCAGFAVGGIPEMIDEGLTGSLAPAGDPDALAEAMRRVLQHAEPRRLRAQARTAACAAYDLAACGRRYRDVLAAAVDRFGRMACHV